MASHPTGLALRERESLRQQHLDATPHWYSPWLHLIAPSLFGLSAIVVCVWALRPPTWWELTTIPVVYVLCNIGEWWAHKYLLHRRHWSAPVLYDQHTPGHHMVYVTDDMAMRSRAEFRLVLIPSYGILLIFLANLAPTVALWLAGLHNVALLFTATVMAYVLSYEWLHLSYHLPKDHPIGRMRIIGWLRHHHAVHHDPKLMQRWNFNVTVPLWDWVRGTMVRDAAEAQRRDAQRRLARKAKASNERPESGASSPTT